jgi:hypothetical protein
MAESMVLAFAFSSSSSDFSIVDRRIGASVMYDFFRTEDKSSSGKLLLESIASFILGGK